MDVYSDVAKHARWWYNRGNIIMWQLLAKPLLGVVADGVKGFVATKKMKGELKLTELKAAKKLKEDQIAGKVKWEQSAVDQMKGSWKDEVSLIVLLLPAVLVFTPFQEHIHNKTHFLQWRQKNKKKNKSQALMKPLAGAFLQERASY